MFESRIVTDHLIASFFLAGFATVLVGLRFVATRVRKTKIWWDDVAAIISLVFTCGMLTMHVTYANHGMRYHITDLPIANMTFITKQLVAYQAVYYAAMASAKFPYLWFYLRIFPQTQFRKWIWVCMGLVADYWMGSMFQIFLICTPFEMNWNPTIPGGRCASYNVAFVTIGIFNMITDLIVMLLLIPFLRGMQMEIRIKIGLAAIFSIRLFVIAITIIRIDVLLTVDFSDLSYSMHHAAFWSVVEPAVAIANCCIATIRPLLKLVSPLRLWSSNIAESKDHAGCSGSLSVRKPLRLMFSLEHDEYPLTRVQDGMSTASITIGIDGSDNSGEATITKNGANDAFSWRRT